MAYSRRFYEKRSSSSSSAGSSDSDDSVCAPRSVEHVVQHDHSYNLQASHSKWTEKEALQKEIDRAVQVIQLDHDYFVKPSDSGTGRVYLNNLEDHDVPILASTVGLRRDRINKPVGSRALAMDERDPADLAQWSDAIKSMLPFINGVNNIAKIAFETNLDTHLVKNNIHTLIYDLAVVIVPDMKLTDTYRATATLNLLFLDRGMMELCMNFITNGSQDMEKPHMGDVFKVLYALQKGSSTLHELQEQHSIVWGPAFDFRRLIIFTELHGFIECIQR